MYRVQDIEQGLDSIQAILGYKKSGQALSQPDEILAILQIHLRCRLRRDILLEEAMTSCSSLLGSVYIQG